MRPILCADTRHATPRLQIPHRWPTASSILSKASQFDNVNPTSDLWNYVVPAFTTGNYAWTRKKYGSQWDWKVRLWDVANRKAFVPQSSQCPRPYLLLPQARYLFYPLTRTILTSNGPLSSSSADVNVSSSIAPHGSWNTRLEAPPVPRRGAVLSASQESGPGEYILAVRAYDAWGGRVCAKTRVWLQN